MKSEKEIQKEIERIREYGKKWPCSKTVVRECELMIEMLQWVLEEEPEQGK